MIIEDVTPIAQTSVHPTRFIYHYPSTILHTYSSYNHYRPLIAVPFPLRFLYSSIFALPSIPLYNHSSINPSLHPFMTSLMNNTSPLVPCFDYHSIAQLDYICFPYSPLTTLE